MNPNTNQLLHYQAMNTLKQMTLTLLAAILLAACGSNTQTEKLITLQNPIIPGYFADPSIVEHEGKFYMYVTADPWGAEFLSCWVSDDFQNWTFNQLNWPTKAACTSPLSNGNNVWAPSVVKKGDAFYMYISVGSEVWCGRAEHPLGPWENMLGNQPMLPFDTTRYCHVIDAEAFIDDDGRAYLYWGSGWDWINGRCFAAELSEDMSSFCTEPVEVTPTRYFEGPLMVKHDGKYYLTYSEGKTVEDTYEVRYAVGDNPLGPFTEAENSPILTTNESLNVYGPGHHTVFTFKDTYYILYHRHRLPFEMGTAYRQTCINRMEFDDSNGQIKNIVPYGNQLFPDLSTQKATHILPKSVTASSEKAEYTMAACVLDKDYSTRWEAAEEDKNAWIQAEFEPSTLVKEMEMRFEYAWKDYYPLIQTSADGSDWETVADYRAQGISGSPIRVAIDKRVTFIRIAFAPKGEAVPSLWEISFQ